MHRKLDPHAALIQTMVLVSMAEGRITDAELQVMSRLVTSLPAFAGLDPSRIAEIGRSCATLLEREDGIDVALNQIADALPSGLEETAYALACDVIAADGRAGQTELRFLGMLRDRLAVEPLVAAAIERAAQARHRRVPV